MIDTMLYSFLIATAAWPVAFITGKGVQAIKRWKYTNELKQAVRNGNSHS